MKYCTEGKHFATENCPSDKIVYGTALNYEREHFYTNNSDGSLTVTLATDDGICIVNDGTECPVHGGGYGPVNDVPNPELNPFLGEEYLENEEEENPEENEDDRYTGETDDEPFDWFIGGH